MSEFFNLDHWFEEQYRPGVLGAPECEDSWFPEALSKFRAGDKVARQRILGSCLRIPLAIAMEKGKAHVNIHVLNLIEEGNKVLDKALLSFPGSQAEEFVSHVKKLVEQRIDSVLSLINQHPRGYPLKWK
jgi:hypothetical protein